MIKHCLIQFCWNMSNNAPYVTKITCIFMVSPKRALHHATLNTPLSADYDFVVRAACVPDDRSSA